jgi:cytochrome P450 family 313
VIPKDATVIIGTYNVHHNTKYWGPSPFTFDPTRFLPENSQSRHPYAFIPFSAGPRNCIGYKYAWMQMKVALCHLLRVYKFKSPLAYEDIKVNVSLTLRLANERLVRIEPRK